MRTKLALAKKEWCSHRCSNSCRPALKCQHQSYYFVSHKLFHQLFQVEWLFFQLNRNLNVDLTKNNMLKITNVKIIQTILWWMSISIVDVYPSILTSALHWIFWNLVNFVNSSWCQSAQRSRCLTEHFVISLMMSECSGKHSDIHQRPVLAAG